MSSRLVNNKLEVFNPANNKIIEIINITSKSQFEATMNKAASAAKKYNYSSVHERKIIISNFRKGIVKYLDDFIDVISNETGKKPLEAMMEVFIVLEFIRQSSKYVHRALDKRKCRVGLLKTRKAWIEYEAMGVVGIISPWNYPLILTASPLVEALLSGNVAIIKPSEQTPLTTKLLKKVWDDFTFQNDLFQPIYGDGKIGEQLVKSSKTDLICFTGSSKIGKIIAKSCAPIFKPIILELGGKDPMIVLPDADINRTVEAAVWGGFSNAGQTCISVERIIVHEKIYEQFKNQLSKVIKKISSGTNDSLIGAISLDSNMEKIRKQINDVRENSDIIEGKASEGLFIPPTLIVNPPNDSLILKEEIFGPVMTIQPYQSNFDAIEMANSSGYGLSASIFGKNKTDIRYISKYLNVGTVSINDVLTNYGIAELPFGGYGLSGIGKVHGIDGLRAFSKQKSYMDTRIKLKTEIWWYNHREKFSKYLKKWISWFYA